MSLRLQLELSTRTAASGGPYRSVFIFFHPCSSVLDHHGLELPEAARHFLLFPGRGVWPYTPVNAAAMGCLIGHLGTGAPTKNQPIGALRPTRPTIQYFNCHEVAPGHHSSISTGGKFSRSSRSLCLPLADLFFRKSASDMSGISIPSILTSLWFE